MPHLPSLAGGRRDLTPTGEMAELAGAAAASFPVVFFDGEREIDIGAVAMHAGVNFKKFQAVICQKIGIAPHQISTSLIRRKKSSPQARRRLPIVEESDFAELARERDCYVLAALRRSRRERRGGRGRRGGVEAEKRAAAAAAVPEKTILRRNPGAGMGPVLGGALRQEAVGGRGLWDYEGQLRELQRQRERYLMTTAMSCYPHPAAAAPADAFVGAAAAAQPAAGGAVCQECREAKQAGRSPGFHWCVYDAVTAGFRSPVGPIQRPPKKQV